jgi:hypothetical protein
MYKVPSFSSQAYLDIGINVHKMFVHNSQPSGITQTSGIRYDPSVVGREYRRGLTANMHPGNNQTPENNEEIPWALVSSIKGVQAEFPSAIYMWTRLAALYMYMYTQAIW